MRITEIGLNDEQVIKSREKYGSNNISNVKRHNFISLFIDNLGDPIIRILLIALAVKTLFFISNFDWYETIGIVIAIFLASLISTLSEYGSESAFKRLQEEASRTKCRVLRNGIIKEIYVSEVVCKDIVLLQSGDKVPADGIIISGSLFVDESALNGESKEKLKDIDNNKVYRGSIISSGEAKIVVTKVGDQTTYGNIAVELQEEQRDSPLKIRLKHLAKIISRFGYIGAILVSLSYLFNVIIIQNDFDYNNIINYLNNYPILFKHLLHALTLAVTVIVVAVPEGLPMMITLVMSLNMKKLLKDNVLVRKLTGIETSGSLNILFTDKTGTLTNGKLEVKAFIDGNGREYKKIKEINKDLFSILKKSILYNNDASLDNNKAIGSNITDRALLEYISLFIEHKDNTIKEKILLFDSKNKMSITKVNDLYYIKGAPEKIISYCKYYYNEKGLKRTLLNKSIINNKIKSMSFEGVRFIVIATSNKIINKDLKLDELSLVGIIGIKDEVREEVPKTIELVKKAGIQVVMITGDSSETAASIAREANILGVDDIILSSHELDSYSDEYIKSILPKLKVVSRALPKDKSRLVKLSQELDLVVGMTGDGVNDAPALKKADVGFGMGSGTEVAKEASDIVILDDNFASIAKSILYGRTIFKSIRKFIIFQLTVNLCAVGLSIIGPFIGINTPITVIQMLWINMVMDTLAALAFAGEPPLLEYMDEKPKRRDEAIINKYMLNQILITGTYSLIICILFLKIPNIKSYFINDMYLMTAFFALFIFMNIFNSFNTRTHRLNLLAHLIKNKGFISTMLFVTLVQLYLIYYGGNLFRVAGLSLNELILVSLIALSIIPFDWFRKIYLRFNNEKGGV